MFPTKTAGCRPCEVGVARAAVGGVLGVATDGAGARIGGSACKGAGAAMDFGGSAVGAASAVFGGAVKRGRGGGATTGRETSATGAGAALAGAAMGGGAIGTRGTERRD